MAAWKPCGLSKRSSGADACWSLTDQPLTAWCALFGRWLTMRAKVTGFAFNFSAIPNRPKTWVFSRALQTVDRFFVFSNVERQLYARLFSLPEQKFEFIHWGVHPSAPGPAPSGATVNMSALLLRQRARLLHTD